MQYRLMLKFHNLNPGKNPRVRNGSPFLISMHQLHDVAIIFSRVFEPRLRLNFYDPENFSELRSCNNVEAKQLPKSREVRIR